MSPRFTPRGRRVAWAVVIPAIVVGSLITTLLIIDRGSIHIKGEFQNPFIFNNGTLIVSQAQWEVRRLEIKEMMASIQYGHMPGRPDALLVEAIMLETRPDGSTHEARLITVIPSNATPSNNFTFRLDVYIPQGAGPFPAIVKVSPDGTGTQVANNETVTRNGFIYACFHHVDLDPDAPGVVGPAQAAYPGYDWGTLAVWAWGAMRVADFLCREPWVDAPDGFPPVLDGALIVTGHSRRGKAALIAGAFDERFDMVDCNGGCAGGAASYLVLGPGAETLADVSSRFSYWFHESFSTHANRESELSFDQHFMRALVAPRCMLSTDGLEDKWANPIGVQAAYEASQPVFDFLNASKNNGIHFRPGGHGFVAADFDALFNFARGRLLGNASAGLECYMTPFDIAFPIHYEVPG